MVFRKYLCDFFRPFDKAEAVSGKVVFSSYVEGFLKTVDTVEIKVVDWKALCALVFVDDGEGGAVYDVVDSESLADGFDESGFAGPHLAVEGEDVARWHGGDELSRGLADVVDAVDDDFHDA